MTGNENRTHRIDVLSYNSPMALMNEYIKKGLSSNDLEKELLSLIGQYNKLRKSYLFVYSSAMSKRVPASSLGMDDYYIIFDLLEKVGAKNLDFYIETPGGSGEAAEEIVRYIRNKFHKVVFVVSGEAKSAGTIMALSGDDIFMTKSGSLGPIDAQVSIGRSVVSAYDYMQWVDDKRAKAEKDGRLNPFDATMVAQISPGELNGVDNSLNFAKDLVVEWLPKFKFKNWKVTETKKEKVTPALKKARAEEIVGHLLNHSKWRSHGRSLKIDDLEKIGLKIKNVDKNKELSDLIYRIQTVVRLLFSSTTTYKIFATAENKIFAKAANINAPMSMGPKDIQVVEFETKCPQCGIDHKMFAKFIPDKQIDTDFLKKGLKPFPNDGRLKCSCGFEIDLNGVRNDIEMQAGKKMVF